MLPSLCIRMRAQASGRRLLRGVGLAAAVGTAMLLAPVTAAGTAAAAGASPTSRSLTPPAVPASGAYLGVDPNFIKGLAPAKQAAQFETLVGHHMGIWSFYIPWKSAVPVKAMSAAWANGSLPMVSLNCGDLDSNVASGADDGLITADAQAFKSYGQPVLFRWFWEMNLRNVTRYNACLGTSDQAAQYVAAYQHIRAIFDAVGASNVAFVWAPSCAIHAPVATAFYPGSSYVDWIGCDLYDRTGLVPFATAYGPTYDTYASYGKPMMITETGSVGSWQPTWIDNIASTLPSQFPQVKAVVYVDAIDLHDYELSGGTSGLAAFQQMAAMPYFDATA